MRALRLIAGETARQRIENDGLSPELVRMVVGASGGPKWLILNGLDKFVFGDWLLNANHKIDLIGSSIGAWRMSCAAHPSADKMFETFTEGYFKYRYSKSDKAEDITRESYRILDSIFTDEDRIKITNNPNRPLHIVAVKCKGLLASPNKVLEAIGLLVSAGANALSRDNLVNFFERAVFHSDQTVALSDQWGGYNRHDIRLLPEALADALMASGSIPFVVSAIKDIAGGPKGVYRDGGVIDYHFDIPWQLNEGIILYPHFYSHLVPGWFDKSIKTRRATAETLDHQLLLAPSDDFVASLPNGAIPDRKNFQDFSDEERLKIWTTVIRESERMAHEFSDLLQDHGALMDRLEMPQ
ncbi:hypothetical protein [Kordiimonas sp. SCSIO 12610]|uniref:hypothetical protein n=1 Tax=Kordiimonas sp. SCSIO 12610 TaxID=2829597 RepID=UPI00210DCF8B|nr:hypothetical protein [Kordiimonas sp. SCSIO 12610]UTW56780.1 hypothetical protein KFF44_07800 [Kordiimonas sp. SCSIO 12610]